MNCLDATRISLRFFFSLCRHLDGSVLESLARPHLLITDAYNAMNAQARRKERDQALLSMYVYSIQCIMSKEMRAFEPGVFQLLGRLDTCTYPYVHTPSRLLHAHTSPRACTCACSLFVHLCVHKGVNELCNELVYPTFV